MADPTNLDVQAGVPFARTVRVSDGQNVWPVLGDVEARMQIRTQDGETSALAYDFTPHLEVSFDGNDVLVEWSLTGQETRSLKGGHYDLFLSDVGVEDVHALRLLHGRVRKSVAVTTAEDV